MLGGKDAQRSSRPRFQQDRIGELPECSQCIGEARRAGRVPGPVRRIACVAGANPGSAYVRDIGDRRRVETHLGRFGLESPGDRFQHPGVKGVRIANAPAEDVHAIQLLLESRELVGRTGRYA